MFLVVSKGEATHQLHSSAKLLKYRRRRATKTKRNSILVGAKKGSRSLGRLAIETPVVGDVGRLVAT